MTAQADAHNQLRWDCAGEEVAELRGFGRAARQLEAPCRVYKAKACGTGVGCKTSAETKGVQAKTAKYGWLNAALRL